MKSIRSFFNAFYCWRGQETIRFCFCYFLLHSSLFKWSSLRPKHKKNVSIKHEKGKRFQRFENFKSHLMSIKWANLRTNFALRIWDFFSPVFSVFECFETSKEKTNGGEKRETDRSSRSSTFAQLKTDIKYFSVDLNSICVTEKKKSFTFYESSEATQNFSNFPCLAYTKFPMVKWEESWGDFVGFQLQILHNSISFSL